jgi:hypothetical protein
MLNELLKSALVLVISFLLRALLTALGVEIDVALFNTLVAAIVAYVLARFVRRICGPPTACPLDYRDAPAMAV